MTRNELSAAKTSRHLATAGLVGLLWLALTALAQTAAGGAWIKTETTASTAVATGNGSGILLYNSTNGAAQYGTIYADGHFIPSANYPAGSFATGWSNIVRASNGLLFFYRSTDGLWATVRVNTFGNVETLRQGYTGIVSEQGSGWVYPMHVVNTPNGIVICRYGGRNESFQTRGGLVGQVGSDGSFRVTQRPDFARWANVVNTPNGLFFWHYGLAAVGRIQSNGSFVQTYGQNLGYFWSVDKAIAVGNDLLLFDYARDFYGTALIGASGGLWSGRYRVGGVNSSGQFALRSEGCSPQLAGGYIIPAVLGNNLFLYAAQDTPEDTYPAPIYVRRVQAGWAMISAFRPANNFTNPDCWGKLAIKQEHPAGTFASGWNKIVYTANGVFFYDVYTGATLVGQFDATGGFTPTHDLPAWFEAGYSHIINVTD